MDERMKNLNLVKILKDCPKGTKLYSPLYGDVELVWVSQFEHIRLPIGIKLSNNMIDRFTKDGRVFTDFNGECMLFPSKEQRDWSKFKVKQSKFDPKTLQPFDKVLVHDNGDDLWRCDFFNFISNTNTTFPYVGLSESYRYCIPYNDDTKHLVGTNEEAPEFYRYWEL